MKEQLRQQEPRFLNSQEVHVAKQTTFRELGIKDTREKRLLLDIEPVTVFSFWDSQKETWTYFGFFDHPFVSSHLAHFLNAGAPYKVVDGSHKDEILADYKMPIEAQHRVHNDRGVSEEYIRLDDLHKGDPVVRDIYNDFVEYGLKQEIKALETSEYDPIFDPVLRLRFVNSQRVEEGFLEAVSRLREEVAQGRRADALDYIERSIVYGDSGRLRTAFLKFHGEQPEALTDASSIWDPFMQAWNKRYKYTSLSNYLREANSILSFLESLSPEEQEQLIIGRRMLEEQDNPYYNRINSKRQAMSGRLDNGVELSFSTDNTFELSDSNGIKIQVEIQPDPDDAYLPFQVTKYAFPPEPLQNALYAVIAWKNTNGKRRFISQKELLEYFPLLKIDQRKKPDAYLGRYLLAYFSEKLTRDWYSRIPLKGGRYPQRMMLGQMAAWPSLDSDQYSHARQLLAGEAIQKLEEHVLVSRQGYSDTGSVQI